MKQLKILMLEDSSADAQLILATLAEEGIGCDAVLVETRSAFLDAVDKQRFDVILSDCSLPSFDGFSALKIAKDHQAATPFIFVSGSIGEELAIETLKSGATDYVLKQRLARLAPAVRRAMAETEERVARQQAEKSRAEAESLFRVVFDQATIGVAIVDLEGRIVRANPALHAMLGYAAAELYQTPIASLSHPDDSASGAEAFADLCAGKQASYELEKRFIRRDGSALLGHLVASLIRGENGAARFSVNLIQDITQRKELEQRFLQAQKMEVVGRLAAGFAHDFNNLLTLINGYSEMLLGRAPQDEAVRRDVQEIRDAGERATTLTQRLLGFSRQQTVVPKVLDLNATILDLDHMLRRLIGEGIQLTTQLDRHGSVIEADQTQIEQLILNLAINARDAMREGGRLTIATGNVPLDIPAAQAHGVESGNYVVLTVSDTGHGMDEITKSRIFEPFFTTKDVGRGTGLGLWMVHETVQACRGAIQVESELGRGTSFRIYLPLAAKKAEADLEALATSIHRESPSVSETVLVVDQDEAVRTFARQALEPAGYRILLARNCQEGVEAARREGIPIHLLIAEPDTQLEGRLAISWPQMKVLHLFGGAERNAEGRRTGAVQKTFTHDDLLRSVREILNARSAATIVIADDDSAIRTFLRQALSPDGYVIHEANDGHQAMSKLRAGKADLLITDLIMPNQEGLETIRAVRQEFPALPILAMSGSFGTQYLTLAGRFGAHEILYKPFTAEIVQRAARRLIGLTPQELASIAAAQAEPFEDPRAFSEI